jgi:IS30 family transposase
LRHGKKWYKKKWTTETRWTLGNILRIDQRPPEVELRDTMTHREVDTIISWTRKWRLVTLVERSSRYIWIKKTSSGQALEVSQCMIDIEARLWIEKLGTITSDNWKKFANREITSYVLQSLFYFANPYHSWERWTNENGNRCIRKHLPKWSEFELLTDADIHALETKLNNKPRKILNYRTPSEVLLGTQLAHFNKYSF